METNEQYLTAEETAQKLSLSVQYIRSLARNSKIECMRAGNTWLIPSKIFDDPDFMFSILPDVKDKKNTQKDRVGVKALSFFSGAMGLDIGLEQAGIHVLLASEIEPNARKTILANHPNIGLIGDIEDYSAERIREFAGLSENEEIDLMVGGPPCQAFSTAGKREGFNDKRGNVFLTYIERIIALKPKIAVIENVRGLLSAPMTHRPHVERGFGYPPLTPEEEKGGALFHIVQLLEKGGYGVTFNLYNAANFGSPQKRERVVIICRRDGVKSPYLTPTHSENGEFGLPRWRTYREVASGLIESQQESLKFPEDRLKYYRMLKPGQYWKHLPVELQKEALGASYFAGGGKTGFLRRLDWEKPAPTLVTDPTMPATDLAHPEMDRPLSVQEYKRVQEFPDDYVIWGGIKDKYKQIGNAVPISLGKAIGLHVLKILNKQEIIEFNKFNYSRYINTDDVNFMKLMKKREESQLTLSL